MVAVMRLYRRGKHKEMVLGVSHLEPSIKFTMTGQYFSY